MERLIDAIALQEEYKRRHDGKRLLLIDVAPTVNVIPCDVCRFAPPSSMDGKPCTMCPAEWKDG